MSHLDWVLRYTLREVPTARRAPTPLRGDELRSLRQLQRESEESHFRVPQRARMGFRTGRFRRRTPVNRAPCQYIRGQGSKMQARPISRRAGYQPKTCRSDGLRQPRTEASAPR